MGGRIVVENHVNVARPNVAAPAISAETLNQLFATKPSTAFFDVFLGPLR